MRTGRDRYVDKVIVDDDGRNGYPRSAIGALIRKERRIDDHVASNALDSRLRNLRGKLAKHGERSARYGFGFRRAVVRVVLVLECEPTVGLDALREVRVAARDEH